MSCVTPQDRAVLDPLIENVRRKTRTLITSAREPADTPLDGYMRHIAERVLIGASRGAAEQYGAGQVVQHLLIINYAGIAITIAFELWDQILCNLGPDKASPVIEFYPMVPAPESASLLNEDIDALVAKITECAVRAEHNDIGTFGDFISYSLVELMPLIVLDYLDDADNGGISGFGRDDIVSLILFWFNIARTMYTEIARPYIDEQIKKNGNPEIYHRILEQLTAPRHD